MIGCKHCQTLNSLDSVFCRKCGTSLPDAELQEAKEKLDLLIAEGTHSFNEGRIDEAFAIAESAAVSNPVSVNALALKGMCHERRGEIAEALEAYEQVVQLNPDSALDKIKLNQLRNLLVARTQPTPVPDRRLASIAAVAASVLVICLGALGATYLNKQNTAQDLAKANVDQKPIGDAGAPENTEQPAGDLQNTTPENQATPQGLGGTKIGEVPPVKQDQGTGLQSVPDDTVLRPLVPQGPIGTGLPAPVGGSGATQVPSGGNTVAQTNNNEAGKPELDPQPTTPPAVNAEEDPGIIEIKVTRGGTPVVGGGEDASAANANANGAEALLRTARNQYETGNFGGAANSYERALRFGADTGLVNQRLGMTYERLGRKDDAIAAYTKAVQSLESAVAKGQTSKQRALDSSRAALATLKGGQ